MGSPSPRPSRLSNVQMNEHQLSVGSYYLFNCKRRNRLPSREIAEGLASLDGKDTVEIQAGFRLANGDEHLQFLADSWSSADVCWRRLGSLGFDGNHVTDEYGGRPLADIVRMNLNTLISLDLSNNQLGDAGIEQLCGALMSDGCALQTLRLDDNRIGSRGAGMVAGLLRMNRSITTLSMATTGVPAGHPSVPADVQGRPDVRELTSRLLRAAESYRESRVVALGALDPDMPGDHGNRIEVEGALAIANMLRYNRTLRTLHILGNPVGAAGAAGLIEAIATSPTLTTIGLPIYRRGAGCLLSDAALTALKGIIRTAPLEEIDVGWVRFGPLQRGELYRSRVETVAETPIERRRRSPRVRPGSPVKLRTGVRADRRQARRSSPDLLSIATQQCLHHIRGRPTPAPSPATPTPATPTRTPVPDTDDVRSSGRVILVDDAVQTDAPDTITVTRHRAALEAVEADRASLQTRMDVLLAEYHREVTTVRAKVAAMAEDVARHQDISNTEQHEAMGLARDLKACTTRCEAQARDLHTAEVTISTLRDEVEALKEARAAGKGRYEARLEEMAQRHAADVEGLANRAEAAHDRLAGRVESLQDALEAQLRARATLEAGLPVSALPPAASPTAVRAMLREGHRELDAGRRDVAAMRADRAEADKRRGATRMARTRAILEKYGMR